MMAKQLSYMRNLGSGRAKGGAESACSEVGVLMLDLGSEIFDGV